MNDQKAKALQMAMGEIEKFAGKGSVYRLGENKISKVPTFSSGSLSLDVALGVGGLSYGRIYEVYGPESSGKTTLTLQAIAEVQKVGALLAL